MVKTKNNKNLLTSIAFGHGSLYEQHQHRADSSCGGGVVCDGKT